MEPYVQEIKALWTEHVLSPFHEDWKPGDVVLDDDGAIWQRTNDPVMVWRAGAHRTRRGYDDENGEAIPRVPPGTHEELEPERPLILLVRDGYAVNPPPDPREASK